MKVGVIGLLAALTMHAAGSHAFQYEIDPAQTKSSYETKYLKFFTAKGVFERVTGTLQYDMNKPVASRAPAVRVVIHAGSLKPITLDSESKRAMLRGPEFFDVERYPLIEFVSSRFQYEGEKLRSIEGSLTLRGNARQVVLTVLRSQCTPPTNSAPSRCEASAEVEVNRREFGMNGWSGTVSETVKIAVDLVAIQREPSDPRGTGEPAATPEPQAPSPTNEKPAPPLR